MDDSCLKEKHLYKHIFLLICTDIVMSLLSSSCVLILWWPDKMIIILIKDNFILSHIKGRRFDLSKKEISDTTDNIDINSGYHSF